MDESRPGRDAVTGLTNQSAMVHGGFIKMFTLCFALAMGTLGRLTLHYGSTQSFRTPTNPRPPTQP